jgi:hypothetical protein
MAKLHHSGGAPLRGRMPGATGAPSGASLSDIDAPIFVALVLGLFAFFFALARSEDARKAGAEEALEAALPRPLAVLQAAPEGPTSEPIAALFSEALGPVGADLIAGDALAPGIAAAARLNTASLFVGRTAAFEPVMARRLETLAEDLPQIASRLDAGGLLQIHVRPDGRGERARRLAARRAKALSSKLAGSVAVRAGVAADPGWHTLFLLEGSGGR